MHDGIGRHVGVVFTGVAGWEVVGGGVAGRDVVGVVGRESGPRVDRWVGLRHDGLFGFGRPGPIHSARYTNVATTKWREFRSRMRMMDRWVSPLWRPAAAVRGGQDMKQEIESSLHPFVGPRSRRGAVRLQVPAKLGVADEFVLRQIHNRRILLVPHRRQ